MYLSFLPAQMMVEQAATNAASCGKGAGTTRNGAGKSLGATGRPNKGVNGGKTEAKCCNNGFVDGGGLGREERSERRAATMHLDNSVTACQPGSVAAGRAFHRLYVGQPEVDFVENARVRQQLLAFFSTACEGMTDNFSDAAFGQDGEVKPTPFAGFGTAQMMMRPQMVWNGGQFMQPGQMLQGGPMVAAQMVQGGQFMQPGQKLHGGQMVAIQMVPGQQGPTVSNQTVPGQMFQPGTLAAVPPPLAGTTHEAVQLSPSPSVTLQCHSVTLQPQARVAATQDMLSQAGDGDAEVVGGDEKSEASLEESGPLPDGAVDSTGKMVVIEGVRLVLRWCMDTIRLAGRPPCSNMSTAHVFDGVFKTSQELEVDRKKVLVVNSCKGLSQATGLDDSIRLLVQVIKGTPAPHASNVASGSRLAKALAQALRQHLLYHEKACWPSRAQRFC